MRRVLSLLMLAPLTPPGQGAPPRDVDLDHVILYTGRLSSGIAEFARRTGVTAIFGGRHPGRGTENALVSLGDGHYLEILAPVLPQPDSGAQLRPTGWALHTRTLDSVMTRMRAAGFELMGPTAGSRRTADSALLQWRTAATAVQGLELAPFFIEWAAGTPHPSTTSPTGCRLVELTVTVADTARLHGFFSAAGYRAALRKGTTAGLQLTLDCPKGRVVFSP